MANLYITEYGGLPGEVQAPMEPPLAIQVISFTATSGASAALQAETKFVSIQLSANGHVQFAASPTATTTTSRFHEANAVSFHGVNSGLKIAAITA